MSKRSRSLPQSLSAAERRVLEAFFRGRLPAGSLSAALSAARRDEPLRAPAAAQPVPALQYAA
jgi:hypothetical protein